MRRGCYKPLSVLLMVLMALGPGGLFAALPQVSDLAGTVANHEMTAGSHDLHQDASHGGHCGGAAPADAAAHGSHCCFGSGGCTAASCGHGAMLPWGLAAARLNAVHHFLPATDSRSQLPEPVFARYRPPIF